MSAIPADCRYSESHEWCRVEGKIATIGITKHAAEALTDLVCIEYSKEVGEELGRDEEFGVVDSVKASETLVSPVAGTVTALNAIFEEDENNLALVGSAPYTEGWLIKVELSDSAQLDDLMDAAQYKAFLDAEA